MDLYKAGIDNEKNNEHPDYQLGWRIGRAYDYMELKDKQRKPYDAPSLKSNIKDIKNLLKLKGLTPKAKKEGEKELKHIEGLLKGLNESVESFYKSLSEAQTVWSVPFPNPKLQHQWDKSLKAKHGNTVTVDVKAPSQKAAINKAGKKLGLEPADARLFVDIANVKENINEAKSKEASAVLKLMDDDYSYQDALKKVLKSDPKLNQKALEKELDKYV